MEIPEDAPVENKKPKKKKPDPEKIAKIRKEILNSVGSGNIDKTRDRVAYILNRYPDTRNSDIELVWAYWSNYEGEKVTGALISLKLLQELTQYDTLIRWRRKIQNDYHLFEANEEVKIYRKVLQGVKRKEALEDRPNKLGLYSVYIDETGKNDDSISVGSLWILDDDSSFSKSGKSLSDWKKAKEINYEFHFSDLNKNRISEYEEFFKMFISLYPTISFKVIVINKKGITDKNRAIVDLTYHLLSKGIEHENITGRAPLPRLLQVWLDDEEEGSDSLKIENIQERLRSQKIEGLFLDTFQSVSSKDNFLIQITDLFTGSINRKLHYDTNNPKDQFADFVLNILDFNIDQINKENNQADQSTVFHLKSK